MSEFQRLAAKAWTPPQSYAGFNPNGDYCIMSQHRDSDSLSRNNWKEACEMFGALAYDEGADGFDSRPVAYHWRAGHCLVGWCEYLMIRADAPREMLERAESMLESLAQYPSLNEDSWSELELTEACDYWESLSVRDRVDVIQRSHCRGVSIFAARRDELPSDDNGALQQYLNGI